MFDCVIKNANIHDGTGKPAYTSDIGVRNGIVANIGDLARAEAGEIVDASGLVVAPGFIDLHTHSDFTLMVPGGGESQVLQGVTTEVVGQCGVSCAPVNKANDVGALALGFCEGHVEPTWRSFDEYLTALQDHHNSLNVAAFVGHGALHHAVLGDALRSPTEAELAEIDTLLEESLQQGAFGFSTGLEYWPGSQATPQDLLPLCRTAARHDVLYATHVRNRDRFYDVAFIEALATAREAGARLQISHIQPKFGAPAGAMQHTLELIRLARQQGVDVAFDVIPHEWAHTRMMAILPQWAHEGGVERVIERLQDPDLRERMKDNPKAMWQLVPAGRWEEIVLLHSRAHRNLIGLSFDEIGKQLNKEPYDAVLDILLDEGEGIPQVLWTSRSFFADDIRLCLTQPECAVMSDTLALANHGPLADQIGSLSGYGWAAEFLSRFVHDERLLTLEDGIRRITSLPAERLGLEGRGVLRPGQYADIVAFDFESVRSRFTFSDPRQHPAGFKHVWVNGELAVRDGARTNSGSGRVLRRNS